MRSNEPQTPLLALLRALTDDQREQLARDARTSVSYLYSLGTCQRTACRSPLAKGIADASVKMNKRTDGATPIVTMEQLAVMCSAART